MSPENYRMLEKTSKGLIEQAEKFLVGKTPDDHIIPMTCIKDVIKLCMDLSEKYQECIIASKNAKGTGVENKYADLAHTLNSYRTKIATYYAIPNE